VLHALHIPGLHQLIKIKEALLDQSMRINQFTRNAVRAFRLVA